MWGMKMLQKIIEYENHLLQDRKELNDLIAACTPQNTDGLARIKIQELQQEIEMMERQLTVLKSIVEYQSAQPIPQQPTQQPVQPANPPVFMQYETPEKKTGKNFENTIGKTIMAVCASVLIFFGLVTFAAVALPMLGMTAKLVLMYVISFLLAGTGIGLSFLKKENKWFLSLAGCGMGALYISLFLTNFYFQCINEAVLYCCIFLWAMGICVLSKMRSTSFLVIGQIGVCLSILVGVVLCGKVYDEKRMMFLVIYSILAELIFYLSHAAKVYEKNVVNHIFWAISLLLLTAGVTSNYMEETTQGTISTVLLMLTAYLLTGLSITVFEPEKKDNIGIGIFDSIYLLVAYGVFINHFEQLGIVILVVGIIVLAVLEFRIPAVDHAGKIILQCVLFWQIFAAVMDYEIGREYLSSALLAAGGFIYGFVKKQNVYKAVGMIYSILFLLIDINLWSYIGFGIGLLVCLLGLLLYYRKQYRSWMKVVAYPLFVFFVIKSYVGIMDTCLMWQEEWGVLVMLAILSAANIMIQKIPVLHSHPLTGKSELGIEIETGILQIFLMILALICIAELEHPVSHALAILLGAILFVTNSYRLLNETKGGSARIYVGLKFLFFVVVVLKSFETPEMFVSLAGLLLAAAFIVAGFVAAKKIQKDWKAVRIFGLVLSLLALAKLILVDIHYDNMLFRAAGFFAAGILCFGISLLYHVVDKKMGREKNI